MLLLALRAVWLHASHAALCLAFLGGSASPDTHSHALVPTHWAFGLVRKTHAVVHGCSHKLLLLLGCSDVHAV